MGGPSEKLAPLEVLIGAWDTAIVPFSADGSDGEASAATDIYRWSPNGQFVYHEVDATMDAERVQSLEVLAHDPATGSYRTHSYDADGTVNAFAAALDGRNWRLTGETQRFSGRLNDAGTVLAGRWEQLKDGSWSPLMRVTLTRRA